MGTGQMRLESRLCLSHLQRTEVAFRENRKLNCDNKVKLYHFIHSYFYGLWRGGSREKGPKRQKRIELKGKTDIISLMGHGFVNAPHTD